MLDAWFLCFPCASINMATLKPNVSQLNKICIMKSTMGLSMLKCVHFKSTLSLNLNPNSVILLWAYGSNGISVPDFSTCALKAFLGNRMKHVVLLFNFFFILNTCVSVRTCIPTQSAYMERPFMVVFMYIWRVWDSAKDKTDEQFIHLNSLCPDAIK